MLAPGKIYPGTSVRITVNFEDEDGDPVDPTTVTFRTFDPCGGSTSYVYDTDDEVGRSAAGAYYADIVPEIAGRWTYRWQTTGTGTVFATEANDLIVQRSPFYDDITDYV